MASRLKLSRSLYKRRSRLQDGQLPDCRRYGSYPETVLDEVIEANCRGTWTINALTGKVGFPSLWSRDVARWVRFGLSVAGPFVCRCLTIRTMLRLSGRTVARNRASIDAAVSTVPPIIPYGGFSPVRLEGWHLQAIRQRLPSGRVG